MFSFLRRKNKNEATSEITSEETSPNIEEGSQSPLSEESINPGKSEVTTDEGKPSQETLESTELIPEKHQLEVSDSHFESIASIETINTETNNQTNISAAEKPQPKDSVNENKKTSFFTRLKNGLSKTRQGFTESLAGLVLGRKEIDEELLDELEMILLTADIGIDATDKIIKSLTDQVSRKELKDPEALINSLKIKLQDIIDPMSKPLDIDSHLAKKAGPFVILMVGINGVGKTTTIGKLAKKYQAEGKSVMLAAGDTFRAAAVEQLQVWGDRNNVPVVAQHTGADSASVLYDALQSAQAKKIDVLIADTAGRLQNKDNLMAELEKVVRVMQKLDGAAPHEVMLVLDAGTGQNALSQAQLFKQVVGVSGITLTKLDGTAKGGIIFAIGKQLGLPIRFIGVGEQIDDLRPFDSEEFVKALFEK